MRTSHGKYGHYLQTEKERLTETLPQRRGQMSHQVFLLNQEENAEQSVVQKDNTNKV